MIKTVKGDEGPISYYWKSSSSVTNKIWSRHANIIASNEPENWHNNSHVFAVSWRWLITCFKRQGLRGSHIWYAGVQYRVWTDTRIPTLQRSKWHNAYDDIGYIRTIYDKNTSLIYHTILRTPSPLPLTLCSVARVFAHSSDTIKRMLGMGGK